NHLNRLPPGKPEQHQRVKGMVDQMEAEGFGGCSFTGACEVECPEGISITNIAEMHNRYLRAKLFG
ncbi:MAG TPA: succinate dehydrogenase/fumarate reductase iron-sulfur subunit, partial [Cytophagales bacterium]|nr:succinate dehydrogenase/fumarate reductase iron-sulfur subunit [Cytophagales bacterium]